MLTQSSRVTQVRKNNFQFAFNPEENKLSGSRFQSPALRLGKVRSWKFVYQSPSRVECVKNKQPLIFSKQAHKLVVRKLPKFHGQIGQDDPLRNSKIIENINYFRQHQRRKLNFKETQPISSQKSLMYNEQVQVSHVAVNLESFRHPAQLIIAKSLSLSHQNLDSSRSRFSIIQGLKSGQQLFQSMVKKQGQITSLKCIQFQKPQNKVELAESRYFSAILGK